MTVATTPLEQKLLITLRRIANGYQTAAQLLRSGEKEYGIDGSEALEYAYENIQQEAKNAIRNVRLPAKKSVPAAPSSDQAGSTNADEAQPNSDRRLGGK